MMSRVRAVLMAVTVGAAAALTVPTPLAAQESDVLRGRVFGPDSAPVQSVTISATGTRSQTTKTTRTDTRGSFTIIFPDGGDSYVVAASAIGFVPQRREVVKEEGQIGFPAIDFRLARVAQPLAPLRVTAQRPRPQRDDFPRQDIGAGATQTFVNTGGFSSGDPTGSIAASLSTIPGLSVISDGTGGPLAVSAYGLGADQNVVTMNGMTMGDGAIPRGMAFGQVSMNSYDPGRNGAGVGVNFFAPSGSNFTQRSLQLSMESPSLQWSDPAASGLGGKYFQGIGSGIFSGAMKEDRAYYNFGWQLQRRSNDLASLTSASAGGLNALGLSSDSLARLLLISNGFGIPASTSAVPLDQLSTQGSVLSRFDYSPTATTTFNVTVNAGFNRNEGGSSATSFPSYGSRGDGWNAQVQPRFSKYFWRSILNETNVAFSTSSSESTPYLALPNARVLVSSTLDDGTSGSTNVLLGGNPSGGSASRRWSSQIRNQTSWYTIDSKHQIRFTIDGSISRSTATQNGNRYGSFVFNSLADFEAGRPATFSRTLNFPDASTRSANWLIGLGDTYRRAQRLQFQYGVQVLGGYTPTRPAYNPAVDSLFGRRTDDIPGMIAWSPMMGFSWSVGSFGTPFLPGQQVPARGTFSGGISQRRGAVSTGLVESVARQTGLPGDLRTLTCVGDAAPVPDWAAYRQSLGSVPDTCTDGTPGAVLVQSNPSVSLIDPRYEGSEAWRMNLGFNGVINRMFRGSITGVYALNLQQPGAFDLNFDPTTRFTLADEANRPVFVSTASISSTTGAVSSVESRRFSQFARVNEQRSDLKSDSRQVMTSLNYTPQVFNPYAWVPSFGLNYVLTDMRDRVRGFSGTTAGDPRVTEWGRSSGSGRHQITVNTGIRNSDWGNLSVFAQFASGRPYTPRVNADINGDGSANDRAFVFDPQRVSDPNVSSAMNALLSAGGDGADCLRRQLGGIATRNSCEGPWTATMRLSASINARRLGLGPRTNVSIWVNNAMAAVDRLVNGQDDLHGWGQPVMPDATLLNVRGFDANTGRYIYEVNPRFGSTAAARATRPSSFSLVLNVSTQFGPPFENMMVRNFLKPRPQDSTKVLSEAQIKSRIFNPARNEFTQLTQFKDVLKLTPQQVDSLNKMSQRLNSFRDSIYTDFAHYLALLPDRRVTSESGKRWTEVNKQTQLVFVRMLPAINGMLTTEQRKKLPPPVASMLARDARMVERMAVFSGEFFVF